MAFPDIPKQTSSRVNLTSIYLRDKNSPSVNKLVDKNIFVNYSIYRVVKNFSQGEFFFARACKKCDRAPNKSPLILKKY